MAEFDINRCHITGTVERFDRIATKTGTAMIKALVRCYKETVQVVAFRDLAEDTDLQAGDRVEVRGRIQNTSWTAQDGSRRYGWQLVAESITLDGETQPGAQLTGETQPPAQQPAPPPHRPASSARQRPAQRRIANQGGPSEFDYSEGPF